MTMPKRNRFLRPSSKRKCISRNTSLLLMQRQIWQVSLNWCIIPRDYIRVEDICLLLSLRPPTFSYRKVDFPRVRSNGFTPNLFLLIIVTAVSAQSKEEKVPMNFASVANEWSGSKTVLVHAHVAHPSFGVV